MKIWCFGLFGIIVKFFFEDKNLIVITINEERYELISEDFS